LILVIVQARINSSRLKGKVMISQNSIPYIEILLRRLEMAKKVNSIIVATGPESINQELINFLKKNKVNYYSGSEEDVLDRFYNAAKKYNGKTIIRITADCPLTDPTLLDQMIDKFNHQNVDYLSNINPPTFPDGFDIEIFTFQALKIANENASSSYDREHVTPFIRKNYIFNKACFRNNLDLSEIRLTLDTEDDLCVMRNVFNYFTPRIDFSLKDVINLYDKNPELFKKNSHLVRNYGMKI
jgi:glutamate-1-semialdehyde 2,1-aminomutase